MFIATKRRESPSNGTEIGRFYVVLASMGKIVAIFFLISLLRNSLTS